MTELLAMPEVLDEQYIFKINLTDRKGNNREFDYYWDGVNLVIFGNIDFQINGMHTKEMRYHAEDIINQRESK